MDWIKTPKVGVVLVLLSLIGNCLNAAPPRKAYPRLDKTYSETQLQAYRAYFDKQHDSLGLAYTYANWTKTASNQLEVELERFKNLLRYLPVIKRYSERDYYQFLHFLIQYFYTHQNRYTIDRSVDICDTIINYCRRTNNHQLEFEAYLSKIYLLKKYDTTRALYDTYLLETKRLLRFPFSINPIYYGIKGDWLLQQKRYDEAIACFKKTQDEAAMRYNAKNPEVGVIALGKLYRLKKNYSRARMYFYTARKVVNRTGNLDLLRWLNEEYANLYQDMGKYQRVHSFLSLD